MKSSACSTDWRITAINLKQKKRYEFITGSDALIVPDIIALFIPSVDLGKNSFSIFMGITYKNIRFISAVCRKRDSSNTGNKPAVGGFQIHSGFSFGFSINSSFIIPDYISRCEISQVVYRECQDDHHSRPDGMLCLTTIGSCWTVFTTAISTEQGGGFGSRPLLYRARFRAQEEGQGAG